VLKPNAVSTAGSGLGVQVDAGWNAAGLIGCDRGWSSERVCCVLGSGTDSVAGSGSGSVRVIGDSEHPNGAVDRCGRLLPIYHLLNDAAVGFVVGHLILRHFVLWSSQIDFLGRFGASIFC
jgi:hypothetical protein